ncbi:MAG: flagellar export chaperone FlgN [Deltaproteobacteria bacterium]|nr:flagellar export chaperone FlgN [Deltaproteobacteria bacterium]
MPQIKQVYESLSELKGLLEELKGLVLLERKDITNLNLPGLSERRTGIETLFSSVRKLNDRTAEQIALACNAFGVSGEKVLSQLITVIPKPDRELFTQLQSFLQRESIKIENDLAINRALLKDSLDFTNGSLQMFTGLLKTNTSNTYGQKGRYLEAVEQPRIICKEI